jgi:lysophospholipase L1-like esterase
MRLFASILLAVWSVAAVAGGHCALRIGENPVVLHDFGRMRIAEFAPTYIWFDKTAGNLVPSDPQAVSANTFNYNTLYRVQDNGGDSWFFRFPGEWFDSAKTHRTAFWGVQWADGKYPQVPGNYQVSSVSAARPQSGKRTLVTIGDSMTWFDNGQSFRCKLAEKLPGYRFIGSHTDSFGFGHDGHGGDNSYQTLQRINEVPTSDAYFLLIGSNDGGMYPKGTASNISGIVKALLRRGNRPHVYVSTLPIRGDKLAYLVHERNAAIRQWYAACGCHATVTLIDTHAVMQREPGALAKYINPAPDLIHPSPAGYDLLSDLSARTITDEDSVSIAKGAHRPAMAVLINESADSRPAVTR